jgi:hypothetical protein
MKLNIYVNKKGFTALLFLITTVSMGCVSTTNSVEMTKPLQKAVALEVALDSEQLADSLADDKESAIQNIKDQIKKLEENIVGLKSQNKRLLTESEKYQQTSIQYEANSRASEMLKTQVDGLNAELVQIKQTNGIATSSLKEKSVALEKKVEKLDQTINDKEQLSQNNKIKVRELTITINDLRQLIETNNVDINNYQSSVFEEHENSIRALWSSLIFLLILTLILLIGFTLFRKATKTELLQARHNLDSEFNKFDLKITELFESQVETMSLLQATSDSGVQKSAMAEPDHGMIFKVLTELHRMKNRLAKMPPDTKGLKPLEKAVERIEENLMEKGYEMVDLLNQPYVDGMTVNQEYLFDESLSPDERIISKVVKPQINFNGVIAQVADVIVSIGE